MINQKWLQTFMDLVETGHFTKTANNLYMTQPGVSLHIKKLESQLNTSSGAIATDLFPDFIKYQTQHPGLAV